MSQYVLALDQGTTSSRAILFDHSGLAFSVAQQEFPQILPEPGHVEHDPEAIWTSQLEVARRAIRDGGVDPSQIVAIGVANQRETTVVWQRDSGRPVANAIVWQSRITAPVCDQLREQGWAEPIQQKTGLVLDAYFSATKLKRILDAVDPDRSQSLAGDLLFGTVDSFLVWRLTGGRHHVTDVSNASRTMLFNIHDMQWDDELLQALNIPRQVLPEVVPTSHVVGETDPEFFGRALPVAAMAGDQQAASFGQACFEPGDAKNTYGTGCFALLNTGSQPVESKSRMLTTVGWQLDGQVTYCLEGSVFVAGAIVQWLRDGLQIISSSEEVEQLAATVPDSGGVIVVPALVGLGAPYWDPYARGAVFGITRGTTKAHLARAAVESMAFQSAELIQAMQADAELTLGSLKVDGGAAVNDDLMQFQADLLGVPVSRPAVAETTALGAAYLAGLAVGFWSGLDDVKSNWLLQKSFTPMMDPADRTHRIGRWKQAVQRTLNWEQ